MTFWKTWLVLMNFYSRLFGIRTQRMLAMFCFPDQLLERNRDRDSQTETETDTNIQRERDRYRHTDRERHTDSQRKAERQTARATQTETQTDRHTEKVALYKCIYAVLKLFCVAHKFTIFHYTEMEKVRTNEEFHSASLVQFPILTSILLVI